MDAWINIPLVYTQLVTLAVNIYFLITLLGRQYLIPSRYLVVTPTLSILLAMMTPCTTYISLSLVCSSSSSSMDG